MATKDERPTLLSKMAMFVRNPTKDWSELDQPQQEEESGYDRQALKAMIERKRQNDFVRRREFDQLRKLRSRDASAVAALGRPSLFQSSVVSDQDGRAVTLKKIDEIEAQMSKQWWKGKQEGGAVPRVAAPPRGASDSEIASVSISLLSDHFATTVAPAVADKPGDDFQATLMGSGMTPNPSAGASVGDARADLGFSASRLFAIEESEMATDPELEEAAIRFANGDDVGAESGLVDALRGGRVEPGVALSWVAALLDLCRATHNRVRFDQVVQEFSFALSGVQPVWARIGESADEPVPQLQAEPLQESTDAPLWDCPSEVTTFVMEDLREALGLNPMPWHLGWSRLKTVTPDAMPLLVGLFHSLCNEPVSLRFTAPERLLQTVQAMMPSGDRSVDPSWWSLRLDILRAMQMQDAFEMAALDYCVTYEVAPPPWEDPRCHVEYSGVSTVVETPAKFEATAPFGGDTAGKLMLQGAVVGDATQALAGLNNSDSSEALIVVNCQGLLRVDFAAAGSILNWVALRQADGCQVQFRGVHRLVAAFFNVIGINEHAQVVPRPI